MQSLIDPNVAFVFANAFEMVIAVCAAGLLIRYILGQINGFWDIIGRIRKIMSRNFQGGPYDLAVAIAVIFVGKMLKAEAIWEWWMFHRLPAERLLAGVAMSAVGAVCLIRVLAPHNRFKCYWIGATILAIGFGTYSATFGSF